MIAILDYGLGNIKAFANIYKNLNLAHCIASDAATLRTATRVILPGVGAFDYAMRQLRNSPLFEPLNELVHERAVPVLGVCVGMQMLADGSEEGVEPGLSWIPGTVRKIRAENGDNRLMLPHMGWNVIESRAGAALLRDLDTTQGFYFLHSYQFCPTEPGDAIANASYGGSFACAVQRGHIAGVQFHPEKSHNNGIRLLRNFAAS